MAPEGLGSEDVLSAQSGYPVSLAGEFEVVLLPVPGVSGTDLRVATSGDTAVLSGEVPSLWQKEMAESVVRRFRVLSVRNEIIVKGR